MYGDFMLNELKKYAKEHQVPIICDEGLEFLLKTIKENKIANVLEVGTAIAYSALAMAQLGCEIDTFERDPKMIAKAKEHLLNFDHEQKIRLIASDALLYKGDLKSSYDLLFIDAAKAQYQKFFEIYTKYLSDDAIIVCDNLAFHNLDKSKVNRNTRQLIIKLEKFIEFLKNNNDFETTFYDVGDGMSISKRIKK